jgi:hypothetical protein
VTTAQGRVFDFSPALARVCCGDPVQYLRAMFKRVAEQLGEGDNAVVILDLRHGQVSAAGARTLAKSVGLAVERTRARGTVLRIQVKRG